MSKSDLEDITEEVENFCSNSVTDAYRAYTREILNSFSTVLTLRSLVLLDHFQSDWEILPKSPFLAHRFRVFCGRCGRKHCDVSYRLLNRWRFVPESLPHRFQNCSKSRQSDTLRSGSPQEAGRWEPGGVGYVCT